MPVGDWQFWVVSAAALVALVAVAWPLLRRRRAAPRVDLTLGGRPVPARPWWRARRAG